jgi:protein MpaA
MKKLLSAIKISICILGLSFILSGKVNAQSFDFDVASVSPTDGEVKVGLRSPVEIEFATIPKRGTEGFFDIEPDISGYLEMDGNILRFQPLEDYEYGVDYTVMLVTRTKCLAYVGNSADCTDEIHWSSSFRAEAHRRVVVGRSVEGRNIYADMYGSGDNAIFFVSALHGSEPVTINITDKWSDYLDNNQQIIPPDKTIGIISVANPDGVRYGIRWNARHVDLNRNWPTNDWQPHTWWGTYYCEWCGGPYAASEPETRYIRWFLKKHGADGLISYHAAGDVIVAGDDEHTESIQWCTEYSTLSGIPFESGGWSAYPVTGDMNVWAVEELDIPSVLVENPSSTNDYFGSHLPALLGVLDN